MQANSRIAIVVFAFFLFSIAPAHCQPSGPTLNETDSWLRTHLPSVFLRFGHFGNMEQHATYTIKGCNITISITSKPTAADYRETVAPLFIIKVESDGDSTSFGYAGDGVVPLGKVNFSSIKVKSEDDDILPLSLGYHDFQVAFTDEDDAQRVANALRHAATLCGAKSVF